MSHENMLGSHIEPEEAAEMVRELTPSHRVSHSCSDDERESLFYFAQRFDGYILELRKIPVADCEFGWTIIEPETVWNYSELLREGEYDYPPLLASNNSKQHGKRWRIEDGNHRITALTSLGFTHVYAYVPADENLEPLPPLEPTPSLFA